MYFGVQYYPEQWPEERWATDAKMMQDAGINAVRMGEFAWSAIEPRDGEYRFEWFDRAIDILADHGVKTLMCTCSRTPPPWVFKKHPEIANVDINGHRMGHGARYTIGHAHPEFIEISQRLDRRIIEHFADNDNVIGWHVDNEVGGQNDCYCPRCIAAFQDYLREKYGTVDALHEAWGSHFWSFTFNDFDEVPAPWERTSPQLKLEYRRFLSKLNEDFVQWRCDLMKELAPSRWITSNFQGHRASHTDYFRMGRPLDVWGCNMYPPRSPELALDYYRGTRGRLIALEQFTRLEPVDTGPGWMRFWAWRSIAHGACGINFFRWRVCRWGQEQHRDGLLPHCGTPNRRYDELVQMGDEIKRIGGLIDRTKPRADIALAMSYESRWALAAGLQDKKLGTLSEVERYHADLNSRNMVIDALDPRADLNGYKLVIAPRLFCVDDAIAANLRSFVSDGGILCLTAASGMVDEFNTSFDAPVPGPLRDMVGVDIDDLSPLQSPVPLKSESGWLGESLAQAELLADEMHPTTAETIATYAGGWRKGQPAITLNSFGNGKVIYVGTTLTGRTLSAFLTSLCNLAGLEPLLETPTDVTAYERRSDDMRLLFLMNSGGKEAVVELPGSDWTDALTGESCDSVTIDAVDLRILRQPWS